MLTIFWFVVLLLGFGCTIGALWQALAERPGRRWVSEEGRRHYFTAADDGGPTRLDAMRGLLGRGRR